jgi:uncharacterized protein
MAARSIRSTNPVENNAMMTPRIRSEGASGTGGTSAARALAESSLYPVATRSPVLLVPGLGDSGPGHWQSLWQVQNPSFRRVVQDDYEAPALEQWSAAIARAIDAAPAAPIVVAHSFGCLAVVHAVARWHRAIAGALLVAPADPEQFGVDALLPQQKLPFPSTLVASTNDPWIKFVKAGALASRWGSRLVGCGDAGHLNTESGHGAWPEGLVLLREVTDRAAAAVTAGAPDRATRMRQN